MMEWKFADPTKHEAWVSPHSLEWYAQLGSLTGEYVYPWRSTVSEPSGETVFEGEVAALVRDKRVLDVGCGHGEFALRMGESAREVVGFDVTDAFVKRGGGKRANVRFVTGNAKDRLPFEDGIFDLAYNRKGPPSAYGDLKRVVRPGGRIIGLHPGDGLWQELSEWFPGLYGPQPQGTPVLDKLRAALLRGGLEGAQVETVVSTEYLHAPEDVLRGRCFGQRPEILEEMERLCLEQVREVFERHRTELGLPVSFVRYVVRVEV